MKKYALRTALCAGLIAAAAVAAMNRPNYFVRAAEEQPAASTSISIDNFTFIPKAITVSKGSTVTWVNHDDVPHTVVSIDKKFKSKALDTDDKFSFTFNESGTYGYFCSVHPVMMGKVIVN
ncbi:MAG: cupredoxin domain-containing protein [Candidatus Sulfotelmatobacter sp.]